MRAGERHECKQDSPTCGRASSNDTWQRRSSSFVPWLVPRAKAGARGSLPEAAVRSAGDGAMRGVGSSLLARPAEVARRSLDAAKGLALPALGTVGDGAGRGILDASLFK